MPDHPCNPSSAGMLSTAAARTITSAMRRRVFALAALVISVLVLAGCQDRYEWHQKITVAVQTPDGIARGSSVRRVIARFGQVPLSNSEVHFNQSGEAVTVDLGNGRYLFALISDPSLVRHVFVEELPDNREGWLQIVSDPARRPQGANLLSRQQYPRLVTFADADRPETVRRVEPNRLSAHFGPGYRLVSITMEITDEPVTEGRIEMVLPCLGSGQRCIPLDESLPYGHPLRHIPNSDFRKLP